MGISSDDRGVQGLVRDLKRLLSEGKGDLNFKLKNGKTANAHSIIVKARCSGFKGETSYLNVTLETFNRLLVFVYTGKLETPCDLFSLMTLSLELGVDDLSSKCEELLVADMDQDLALKILKEAQEQDNTPARIVDTCIVHLSQNSVKFNPRFLDLDKDVVKVILQSEQFCLEEEEVWRCVLHWAQHKAGVQGGVVTWTEDQRLQVSFYLNDVISHVRLLLIDSRVFAEEVEPTGCVPMALSLERYRYAALAETSDKCLDPRLTPRKAQKVFLSNLINEKKLGKRLQEWTKCSNWKCIYRASLHGFGAEEFHHKVDGVKNTLVVIAIRNSRWICGGFTEIPWTSSKSPRYMSSSESFLFRWTPNQDDDAQKFNVVKKHFAVCHHAESGPIFGAGADLFLSSDCNLNSDSYSNLPHSYEDGQLTEEYNFCVQDYEVFVKC